MSNLKRKKYVQGTNVLQACSYNKCTCHLANSSVKYKRQIVQKTLEEAITSPHRSLILHRQTLVSLYHLYKFNMP